MLGPPDCRSAGIDLLACLKAAEENILPRHGLGEAARCPETQAVGLLKALLKASQDDGTLYQLTDYDWLLLYERLRAYAEPRMARVRGAWRRAKRPGSSHEDGAGSRGRWPQPPGRHG